MGNAKAVSGRPTARRHVDAAIVDKLRKTAEKGGSVRIPLAGEHISLVRARYRSHLLLKYRLRLASKAENGLLVAWTEGA